MGWFVFFFKYETLYSVCMCFLFCVEITTQNMLFLEVPPYRDRAIPQPVKVNFYVINGKKKRSQPQHFVYTPHRGTDE